MTYECNEECAPRMRAYGLSRSVSWGSHVHIHVHTHLTTHTGLPERVTGLTRTYMYAHTHGSPGVRRGAWGGDHASVLGVCVRVQVCACQQEGYNCCVYALSIAAHAHSVDRGRHIVTVRLQHLLDIFDKFIRGCSR